ncbi:aldehyde reductase II [Colletotrichum orchidophilum]|uniref:Aldehyde reductase II n=1 Tax=Colletotrichum orchidophilum TaxID=1209926 RepID=A0A1G4BAT6_9PEZI|nr:aldehyde reductase II [Colletotrichum orchidophilum]OHE98513.1 aldehyde reductase II [Colletotrichum orchidophilum]
MFPFPLRLTPAALSDLLTGREIEIRSLASSHNRQTEAIALSGKGPGGMAGRYITYSAASARVKLELWKWYDQEKPRFRLELEDADAVPNAALGKFRLLEHQGFLPCRRRRNEAPLARQHLSRVRHHIPSSLAIVSPCSNTPPLTCWTRVCSSPKWYCDIIDIARIHIEAPLSPDVQSKCLVAHAGSFNINDLLAVFRLVQPDRTFPADLPNLASDKGTIANERATQLMQRR